MVSHRSPVTKPKNTGKGWTLAENAKSIHRNFTFKGFNKTMNFVNAIAWPADREGHHLE